MPTRFNSKRNGQRTTRSLANRLTHHAFAFDTDVVLLHLAWRPVYHHQFVSVEETLASWHAIQFALVRPARVRNPTANDFALISLTIVAHQRRSIDLPDNSPISPFEKFNKHSMEIVCRVKIKLCCCFVRWKKNDTRVILISIRVRLSSLLCWEQRII